MSRSLQFDALEHRIAMSAIGIYTGFAMAAHGPALTAGAAEVRADASTGLAHPAAAAAKSAPLKGNFHGGQSLIIPDTDYVAMTDATGKLDKTAFTATMYGQVSGASFEGGTFHLFNSSGAVVGDLSPGKLVYKGKIETLKVGFQFEYGTGAYSSVGVWAGTTTFAIKPQKSAAQTAMARVFDWSGQWDYFKVLLLSPKKIPNGLFNLD